MQKLFVDDRQRFDRDKREVVDVEERELPESASAPWKTEATFRSRSAPNSRIFCCESGKTEPLSHSSTWCTSSMKSPYLGVVPEHEARVDPPAGEPVVGEDIALAKILEVDEFADHGVREATVGHAVAVRASGRGRSGY